MFRKLRWKLTAFNTAITGGILLGMMVLCLVLSEANTKEQTLRSVSDRAQVILTYLESQNPISSGQLRQLESDPNLHLYLLDGGKPLFSMTLSPEKTELSAIFQQAQTMANGTMGVFPMEGYYGGYYTITKGDSRLELVILYALTEMESRIQSQRLLVLLAAFLAIGVLGFFSWFFTGKMLRPIQENQKRQTEFIAAASHELRTPLAAILSAVSAMERAEPVQRSQFSHMIYREGSRMSRLIGDMLTLASGDSQPLPLQKTPVEPDMLLLEAYEAHAPLLRERELTLNLSLYEQEIPPLMLDKDRILQVLAILLDNAAQHTPAGGKIELELTRQRNRVQLRVSDSGPGVPDSEKGKIFERFYRSETSRSDSGHFGLGLSIAADIVKGHGGKIWVQDATIGGAEFVVELPIF